MTPIPLRDPAEAAPPAALTTLELNTPRASDGGELVDPGWAGVALARDIRLAVLSVMWTERETCHYCGCKAAEQVEAGGKAPHAVECLGMAALRAAEVVASLPAGRRAGQGGGR